MIEIFHGNLRVPPSNARPYQGIMEPTTDFNLGGGVGGGGPLEFP